MRASDRRRPAAATPPAGGLARTLLALLIAGSIAAPPLLAQQPGDLETRLRDALRQATSRVRTLEDDNARLAARQAELEAELARRGAGGGDGAAAAASADALKRRIGELERLFGEREKAYQEAVDAFNVRLAEERQQALQIQEAGQRWKAAHEDAARLVRAREAERQALAAELASVTAAAAGCAARNRALFQIGSEILDRYAAVDMADVLARREPFIGTTRVALENQVQDDEDRLLDNRIDATPPPATTPPATTPPAAAAER